MRNATLEKLRAGAQSLGAWIGMSDGYAAESIARLGFDWVCIDLQHGLLSYSHLLQLIPALAASGVTPLVRVAANDPSVIGRVLDAGARGVIVPMVNTPEQAAAAVRACRYPPAGIRSCGPMRDAMIEGGAEYLSAANAQIACILMIETLEGLDNVEAIATTPGVDALFIGPMDLCYGLGIMPGDFGDARFVSSVSAIAAACRASGCAAGFFGYTPQLARKAVDEGFTFISVGTDATFLRAGAKDALDTVLEVASPSRAAASY